MHCAWRPRSRLPIIEDVVLGTLPLTIKYHPAKGDPWAHADLVLFETPTCGDARCSDCTTVQDDASLIPSKVLKEISLSGVDLIPGFQPS